MECGTITAERMAVDTDAHVWGEWAISESENLIIARTCHECGAKQHGLNQADCVLPTDLVIIEDDAFFGCVFRSVRLPDGAESIGKDAFAESDKLEYIYIPESVKEIDADAFDKVEGLTIIGVPGSVAESFAHIHGFGFLAS